MNAIETDYLIIGAGACALAFADTLLDAAPGAHLTLVDRHGAPGGHWNDAYPFVTLHQPSAYYGVPSLPLGSGRIDTHGLNEGYHELASGAEVCAHFVQAMHERLLPSGRVAYRPMCEYLGPSDANDGPVHRFASLLSGEETQVHVRRKVVDATYLGTAVPATHRPNFDIAPGVRLVPPGALPHLWRERAPRPEGFVVLGAGKTAMDAVVWLQQCGAAPASIAWVRPRDSWLIDRGTTQPGVEFFQASIGAQADTMEALGQAADASALFELLEQRGCMLRIDRAHAPTMFHFATVSRREVELLRRVERVIRRGRVRALHADRIDFGDNSSEPVAPGTLFIDCTASAVTRRPPVPVFQPGRITLQMVRIPQPTFSASLVAHLEALHDDDALKNKVCAPIPLPDTLDEYPRALLVHMRNQHLWNQDAGLRQWIRSSRLDAWGRMIDETDPTDSAKQALLGRMRAASKAAAAAAPRWIGAPTH